VRPDNEGAKAGNLNAAMKRTRGELIAIFDADHVPVRGFLKGTVGFFLENPRLGLVQTPHHFYNPDPFERNLGTGGRVPPEQHLFYHGVQLGNDFWNSAFFCGSCAVIRRTALEEVGGICTETVTEDAHTALNIHARGWDSVFYDVPLAAGLATESYADHVGQRIRWARGMAQIFRLDNPLLKSGLTLPQRITYFSAAWHFFYGLPRLVYILTPALYVLFDLHPLDANVREVLMYAIPHLMLLFLGTESMHKNLRHSFWPEVYEVSMAPYAAAVTTVALVAPQVGSFNVTAKGGTQEGYSYDWRSARPLLVLFGLALVAMFAVPWKLGIQPLDRESILIAAVWNSYNLIVLIAALMTAFERPQRRRHHRIARRAEIDVSLGGLHRVGHSIDMSMGGLAFELPGQTSLPDTFDLQLISGPTSTPPLPFHVAEQRRRLNSVFVRGWFGELDASQQAGLGTVIFSNSDAWVSDSYAKDSLLRSGLSVLTATVLALLRKPEWSSRLLKPKKTLPLVKIGAPVMCDVCLRESPVTSGACEYCGAALVLPRSLVDEVAPRPGFRLSAWVAPALVTSIGLALALSWSPLVSAFNTWMPLAEGHTRGVTERKADLLRAHGHLRALHLELSADLYGRRLPRPDFGDELSWLRLRYKLYGDPSRCLGCESWESSLHEALQSMAAAERELRAGLEDEILETRLLTVDDALNSLDPVGR